MEPPEVALLTKYDNFFSFMYEIFFVLFDRKNNLW